MNQSASKKYVLISAGVLGLLLVGWLVFSRKDFRVGESVYFGEQKEASLSETENVQIVGGAKIYKDPSFGFSVRIPTSAKVTSFQEGEGQNILIQDASYQMQIYVSGFDENIALTAARIKKDIPDIKMENPMEIETGGVATVAFVSNDRGAPYREIWFVNKGNLYQVLAPADQDPMTATIMQSWVWN